MEGWAGSRYCEVPEGVKYLKLSKDVLEVRLSEIIISHW